MDPIITQPNDFLVENLFRGDSSVLNIAVTRSGVVEDLTGATVWFTAKEDLTDTDAEALMAYDNIVGGAGGVTVPTPASGIVKVTFDPTDAALAPLDTPVFADVQVKTAIGEIFTAAFGQLIFRADVTQRVS